MGCGKIHKVGLFGTSADPFTVCHMAIIDAVLDSGIVDRVIVVPTIVDYHRAGKEKWLEPLQKLNVINAALYLSRNSKKVSVDMCELYYAREHSDYVCAERRYVHTLKDIIWKYEKADSIVPGKHEFYTILGTDSLANFKSWYRWEDILECSKIIGISGRDGVEAKNNDICDRIVDIDKKYSKVSATEMRSRFSGDGGRSCIDAYMKFLGNGVIENKL